LLFKYCSLIILANLSSGLEIPYLPYCKALFEIFCALREES
jgi:hypothetical protein